MDNSMDFSNLSEMHPDLLIYFMNVGSGSDFYPLDRPIRTEPVPLQSQYIVHPNMPKQLIHGIGFEIMSDSIGSANVGLPDEPLGVPHDLVPEERTQFYAAMLEGFRYCRLAGGLFWRGLDTEQRHLRPRWHEQLDELREMITVAGIEGVSFEYWSPPPFWKANRAYIGNADPNNRLRCFGKDFADDPIYHGDVGAFLQDFAESCRQDLLTLRAAGIPVVMWNMQAEPFTGGTFPTCVYEPEDYAMAFKVVAPVVRSYDPNIMIIADTAMSWDFPYIRPVLNDPEYVALVDMLAIHLIGFDAKSIRPSPEPSGKPRFTNEFEYLHGPTSPARCLNTVETIMNWFQLADASTWFWLHALKPYTNEEASGYSLGYWRPSNDTNTAHYPPELEPGHWIWNKYNWYAVGSFVKHMPWDCRSVTVTEADISDNDLRICAFKRPDDKLTIVVANRSFVPHTFRIDTGLKNQTFLGYRYTPKSAGQNCQGVPIGELQGHIIAPLVPDMAWEFWEEI